MIDPKTSLQEIFIQYPSLRLLYEQEGKVTDDSITTEQFCDRNDIPLLEFWMSISRETNKINIQKSKELEICKKTQEPQAKFVKFTELPQKIQDRIVFLSVLIIVVFVLYIVAWLWDFDRWIKNLCIIVVVVGSTKIASLIKQQKTE